jgi:glycosyltransferase involved in cell wall biosynthesis
MPSWLLERYEVCLPRASLNVPDKSFGLDANMRANSNRPRLVAIVNSSIAVGFLQGQLQYFQGTGFDATLICPERRKDEWEVARPDGVSIINVPIQRGISPIRDLASLYRLWRILRELRPTITNVGTPKAGLLGGLAAWLNRVPCRFYTLHGLRFETTKGLKRRLLIYAERLACRFAHRVICVSKSVREKAIASGLLTQAQAVVLGSGSCNGVDTSRFAATPGIVRQAADLRHRLGIPAHAPVVLFIGRFTRDKGIPELLEAFQQLNQQFPEARLLFVGCFEDGDPLPADIRRRLKTHPRVILAGTARDTAPYYALADMLVLPSHREGLPTVILEAHAAGKPVIGASATGIVDVVVNGETGLLFPIGDAQALAEAMARLVIGKALARKMGLAGQEQVKRSFGQEQIWQALRREYLEVLQWKESPRSFVLPQPEN